jgi:hypothetical protein
MGEKELLEKAFFDGFMAGQASGRLEGGLTCPVIDGPSAWAFWRLIYLK